MPTLSKIKQENEQKDGKPRNAKDNQQSLHRYEQKPYQEAKHQISD
jgi:hypothetical protein